MNKLKQWIRDHLFLDSLAANILVLIFYLSQYRPMYESNDDLAIQNIASGVLGYQDFHIVYENIILGRIYQVLYHFRDNIPWYALLMYAAVFLSLTGITYILLKRCASLATVCALFVFLLGAGYECYVNPQFTKTAGVICCAGMLLLFWYIYREGSSVFMFLLGTALLWISSMYRFEQFGAEAVLFAGLIPLILHEKKKEGKTVREMLRRGILIFLPAVILVLGSRGIDKAAYRSSAWQNYRKFNVVRSKVLDTGLPSYEKNKELYNSLGIYRASYELLKSWNYADPEVFSRDAFEKIAVIVDQNSSQDLGKFFTKAVTIPLGWKYFYCLTAIALLCMTAAILRGKGKAYLYTAVCETVLFLALYYYMFAVTGRVGYNRVDTPLMMAVSLCLLWSCAGSTQKAAKIFLYAVSAAVPAIFLCLASKNLTPKMLPRQAGSQSYIAQQALAQRNRLLTFAGDKDHFYVAKNGTISVTSSLEVFGTSHGFSIDNISWLGGWDIYTPAWYAQVSKYGLSGNLYKDMFTCPGVRVLDNNMKRTLLYLRKHYGEDIDARKVADLDGSTGVYEVYKKAGAQ